MGRAWIRLARAAAAAALCVALAPAPAWAFGPKLTYLFEREAAPDNGLRVQVDFVNDRPAKRGADTAKRFGHIRAGGGWPYGWVSATLGIDELFSLWLGDLISSTGARAVQGAPARDVPRVRMTCDEFFIDGYMAYDLDFHAVVEVFAAGEEQPVGHVELQAKNYRVDLRSHARFSRSVADFLEALSPRVEAALATPRVAAILGRRSASPAGPESAPAAPSAGGCQSDAECKGDRICVAGRCEDPP